MSQRNSKNIRTVYKIGGQIGEGAQAHVKRAKNRETQQQVAIKIFNKHRISE